MVRRIGALAALFVAAVMALLWYGPIPQDPAFHAFADWRTCLGVPNFGNVVSNAAFVLVGGYGLWVVHRLDAGGAFADPADVWCFRVFFVAVALVSVGSAYYHAAPDNQRLFWDRLPMTVAFMALSAAFLIDRIPPLRGARWVLPLLVGIGVASVTYWRWSESVGSGDLRPYFLVQFFPMLALPLICIMFPRARTTSFAYLVLLLAWYGAAMLCEQLDHRIFAVLDGAVSGHTIKHVLAAMAPLVVAHMLITVRRRADAVPA